MIEKITVSRDEVLNYPWLDHTWVDVHFQKNDVTQKPLFAKIVVAFIKKGVERVTGNKYDGVTAENGYFFIKYDTDNIIGILKKVAEWFLSGNLHFKDPEAAHAKFLEENKSAFIAFFEEMKDMLENKTYQYYYQSVDGLN